MTTNRTTSSPVRFSADTTALTANVWIVRDRLDGLTITSTTGRAEARRVAAVLNSHAELITEPQGPAPRKARKGKAEPKADATSSVRTSHADCAHVATKLARAICRREAAKATVSV